jgi:hypothetical protein
MRNRVVYVSHSKKYCMLQYVSLLQVPRIRSDHLRTGSLPFISRRQLPETRHYQCTQICFSAHAHIKDMWDWFVACKPADVDLITHSHGETFGHQITAWRKTVLQTLTVPQLVNKFPAFYRTQRFTTVLTTANHLSLSWGRSIEYTPSAFYNLHFNIILPSIITSHKRSLSHRIPHKNIVCSYTVPHTCHMTRPSRLLWFDSLNNIWWEMQSLKLLIMWASSLSGYLVPSRPKYIPQHPILERL